MGRPVMHWQIHSKNPDQSTAFYTRLFDWAVSTDNALGTRMIDTGSGRGINGNIWPAPEADRGCVSLYVEVDDIPKYIEKAQGLGANVIIPHQKLPDGDEMAVIVDPEGIPIGLMTSAGTPA